MCEVGSIEANMFDTGSFILFSDDLAGRNVIVRRIVHELMFPKGIDGSRTFTLKSIVIIWSIIEFRFRLFRTLMIRFLRTLMLRFFRTLRIRFIGKSYF